MSEEPRENEPAVRQVPLALAVVAGLFLGAGAGHLLLKRRQRGLVIAAVYFSVLIAVNVLSAKSPSAVTVGLLLLPRLIQLLSLIDLVRVARIDRSAEKVGVFVLSAAALVALNLAIQHVVARNVTYFFATTNDSMAPTLITGDQFAVSKLLGAPKRGDIVVVRDPGKPGELSALRVVGIGGDEIEIASGMLSINGDQVETCFVRNIDHERTSHRLSLEPVGTPHFVLRLPGHDATPPRRWQVPPGELFVLGDYRPNTNDSRAWNGGEGGTVKESAIEGIATFFVFRGGQIRLQDIRRVEPPHGALIQPEDMDRCRGELGLAP